MTRKMQAVPADPELDAKLEQMEEDIERELAKQGDSQARVNFRWGREQLTLVKRAAAAMGIPYQTYIQQAAFRQAAADLQSVQAAS